MTATAAAGIATSGILFGSLVFISTASAAGIARGDASPRVVQVDVDFSWDGVRNCESQRPGSVICISAQATVPGLGLVEYARDAVPNGQTTPDGCLEFSTHGQLWVPGGTAQFDGVPVPTCGATDNPDAHYTYTVHDGTGVLQGAHGVGDVVADNGKDRWHGTITLTAAVDSAAPVSTAPASAAPTASSSAAQPEASGTAAVSTGSNGNSVLIVAAVIGGLVVVGAVIAIVVRLRAT
jgi:hypothetical protein